MINAKLRRLSDAGLKKISENQVRTRENNRPNFQEMLNLTIRGIESAGLKLNGRISITASRAGRQCAISIPLENDQAVGFTMSANNRHRVVFYSGMPAGAVLGRVIMKKSVGEFNWQKETEFAIGQIENQLRTQDDFVREMMRTDYPVEKGYAGIASLAPPRHCFTAIQFWRDSCDPCLWSLYGALIESTKTTSELTQMPDRFNFLKVLTEGSRLQIDPDRDYDPDRIGG